VSDKLEPGTRVMVYNVDFKWGQLSGYVVDSAFTRHPWEVAVVVKGQSALTWVHRKQVRVLKEKREQA
jgi:hypothetical protein